MSTSSTPIRVDTKEVEHIHVLLSTLEYFVPVGSPVVPGLTLAGDDATDAIVAGETPRKPNPSR